MYFEADIAQDQAADASAHRTAAFQNMAFAHTLQTIKEEVVAEDTPKEESSDKSDLGACCVGEYIGEPDSSFFSLCLESTVGGALCCLLRLLLILWLAARLSLFVLVLSASSSLSQLGLSCFSCMLLLRPHISCVLALARSLSRALKQPPLSII